jgi:hypothetical protein
MIMVAFLQLVLNDYGPAALVFGNHIDTEVASGTFTISTQEIEVKCFIQNVNVAFKPLREILRFMFPHFAQSNALQASNVQLWHRVFPY